MGKISKLKSYRINHIMQEDIDLIKEKLKVNETAAIMWALRTGAEKLKDEDLLYKSSDQY